MLQSDILSSHTSRHIFILTMAPIALRSFLLYTSINCMKLKSFTLCRAVLVLLTFFLDLLLHVINPSIYYHLCTALDLLIMCKAWMTNPKFRKSKRKREREKNQVKLHPAYNIKKKIPLKN